VGEGGTAKACQKEEQIEAEAEVFVGLSLATVPGRERFLREVRAWRARPALEIHHELEVVFRVSRGGHEIPESLAMDHIDAVSVGQPR
jgi:2-keto-4-pentenoate hydratase/2-oxohepta-3-ene-1,7-dioic acid hydratase in catechol pathway